ncbi:MAG: hypothetical protein AB8E82_17885 [Aureispira sp.]
MKKLNYLFLFMILWGAITSCSKNEGLDPDDTTTDEVVLEGEFYTVTKHGDNHHSIYSEIIINAPTSKVWNVLTDWNSYTLGVGTGWSTTFLGLELIGGNSIGNGATVDAYLYFDGFGNGPYRHTLIYTEGVEFGWSDPIAGSNAIADNHFYRVEAISATQTKFIQTDTYKGVDTNGYFTTEGLALGAVNHFTTFNQELKVEVEKR